MIVVRIRIRATLIKWQQKQKVSKFHANQVPSQVLKVITFCSSCCCNIADSLELSSVFRYRH